MRKLDPIQPNYTLNIRYNLNDRSEFEFALTCVSHFAGKNVVFSSKSLTKWVLDKTSGAVSG